MRSEEYCQVYEDETGPVIRAVEDWYDDHSKKVGNENWKKAIEKQRKKEKVKLQGLREIKARYQTDSSPTAQT